MCSRDTGFHLSKAFKLVFQIKYHAAIQHMKQKESPAPQVAGGRMYQIIRWEDGVTCDPGVTRQSSHQLLKTTLFRNNTQNWGRNNWPSASNHRGHHSYTWEGMSYYPLGFTSYQRLWLGIAREIKMSSFGKGIDFCQRTKWQSFCVCVFFFNFQGRD